MPLFQSNLRKQIRNLPKILNFVRIIHYFSKLFTSLLTPHPAAGDGDDAEVVLALLLQRGALADVDARNLSRPRNTNFEEVPIRK